MRIFAFFAVVFFAANFFVRESFAAFQDGFFLRPALTIEYAAPRFVGSSAEKMGTETIAKQIFKLDNIALGFHGRVHKYLGFNLNWMQTDMSSPELRGYSLSQKATFGMTQYNASALFFLPAIEDSMLEAFAELGVADIQTVTSISETNGNYNRNQAHETKAFAGFGFQFLLSDYDAIRFGFQRYIGKLSLLDANMSQVRLGYVKSF